MASPYRVCLGDEQRARLRTLVGSGAAPAPLLTRARVLLRADHAEGGPGWSDAAIAGALDVDPSAVPRERRQFVAEGLEPTLARKRPDRADERTFDGRARRTRSPWPTRRRRRGTPGGRCGCRPGIWSGSRSSGRPRTRRCGARSKNEPTPWLSEPWCPAPTADPAFVWHTEDVLDVYTRSYDPARPVVCLGATSRRLLGEARPPPPATPGRPARRDPGYVRGGVATLFLVAEPRRGRRAGSVGDRRTRLDSAACLKELVGAHDPDAERIVLVPDRPHTHSPASLDAAFPPAEAKRPADRLEIRHTVKHGSRLTIAEPELAALQRRCLARRLGDREAMAREGTAWAGRRNAAGSAVDRHFTTADARIKRKRPYPAIHG